MLLNFITGKFGFGNKSVGFFFFFAPLRLDFRYELAEGCADDDDAKLAISKLRRTVLEELKMHNSFVQVR